MEERRKFARVEILMPIKYKKVTEEKDLMKPPTILGDPTILFPKPLEYPKDPVISDWLKYINAKLDFIISILTSKKKTEDDFEYKLVNLSAGGINFETKEEIKKDEILEIEMILEETIPTAIKVLAKVVWCERIDNRWKIGANFLNPTERILEILARFVFEKQRELLSKKRLSE
ncbi:MAG: PilZ domain-containing protein [Thermosulfidibacteraceae bacterium]|jgi:c-di-GMP-binding flagellar brake protein YcgR